MDNLPHARIAVRLTPRGGRDAIDGWQGNELRARVAAPAVDGRANRALIRLLGRALEVAPSSIAIVRGDHSRSKIIEVQGFAQAEAERRLAAKSGQFAVRAEIAPAESQTEPGRRPSA